MQITFLILLVLGKYRKSFKENIYFFLNNHLVPSITALKCYECNSNVNPECESGENLKKFEKTCSPVDDPHCRKIVQTGNDDKIIRR
jgi:hypothetical protein